MPVPIQNLVILGDSLSDIGIKRETPAGMFARAAGMMRTNEIGRYSDGKNWVDFLVEWAGSEPLVRASRAETEAATAPYRSLTERSLLLGTDATPLRPLLFADYAEGGAIATSDWKPKAGALGYIKDQVTSYIEARKALRDWYTGDTLHIVWIGLNDIVTAERPEGLLMEPRAVSAGGVYQVPSSKKDKPGTGITPMAEEVNEQLNRIADAFPATRNHEHFILVDLPDPGVAVRFQDKIADKGGAAVTEVAQKVRRYNDLLLYLARYWPAPEQDANAPAKLGADPANITLVQMSAFMQRVSDHPEYFDLTPLAQLNGPVKYLGAQDTLPPKLRRALTTSDLAHPTEAVYELIARQIADVLLTKYTLGRLNQQTWPAKRPFPNA
ncbi:hypothetical protein GPX89_28035 [Nocardia sp. ET3-3]|uniref:Uncharacterized protein n=1 Tax=Nocardia terrae TaxID=2675851 RepID=A0A7K1V3A5_9NOCA|nr:SGNH/GDSL hydrolase family protein [Nocardia terrae]MVU81084.1 hypothetical protein [Nocardia terrae]